MTVNFSVFIPIPIYDQPKKVERALQSYMVPHLLMAHL